MKYAPTECAISNTKGSSLAGLLVVALGVPSGRGLVVMLGD